MKRILFWFFIAVFSAATLSAQESATQQQLDQLNGKLQDLLEGQAAQGKMMNDLQKQISELREKVNAPAANDYAGRDDLKRIAEAVQEVDRKRQADKELILKNLEQLGKVSGDAPLTHGKKKKSDAPKTDVKPEGKAEAKTDAPAATDGTHYEYKVQPGDSLGAIIKAYRDKGVKVTRAQVLKANPTLDPDKLFAGKTIIIPDPTAK